MIASDLAFAHRKLIIRGYALTLLTALLIPAFAQAAWVIEPTLQVQGGYNTNPALVSEDEESGATSVVSASAEVRNVTEDRTVRAAAGASYRGFHGVDQLEDREAFFLRFNAGQRYERAAVRVSGLAQRDTILRRALDDFAGSGVDGTVGGIDDDFINQDTIDGSITENAIRQQIDRDRFEFEPSIAYRLTERNSAQLTYEYRGLRFDDEGDALGLQESDQHYVSGQFSRRLTPQSTISFNARAGRFFPFLNVNDADLYQASVRLSHKFSEQFDMAFEVGGRQVDTDFGDNSGELVNISASWRGETQSLRASLRRDVNPDVFGTIIEADQFTVAYQRALSERLTLNIPLRYLNTGQGGDQVGAQNRDRSVVVVAPFLNYALTPEFEVGLRYIYQQVDRDIERDVGEAHEVAFILSYRPQRQL